MQVGPDAAPPGGAGAPPAGTTTRREELADGGPSGQPAARMVRLTQKPPPPQSQRQGETDRQKARPGAVTTLRWRAERRHAPVTVRAELQWPRRLARHPLGILSGVDSPRAPCCEGHGNEYGAPGAANNTGDDARLFGRSPPFAAAEAGTQCLRLHSKRWMPACAGMSGKTTRNICR